MSALKRRAWLLLAATLTLQIVITRSARVLGHDKDLMGTSGFGKRSDNHAVHVSCSCDHLQFQAERHGVAVLVPVSLRRVV